MKKIIEMIKNSIDFKDTTPLEKRINLLNSCYKGLNTDNLINSARTNNSMLHNTSYTTVFYAYLLTYYNLSLEEVEEYKNSLIKFFKTDNLTEAEKTSLAAIMAALNILNSQEPKSIEEKTEKKFYKERAERDLAYLIFKLDYSEIPIIECLALLSASPYFKEIFPQLANCFYETKPEISFDEIQKFYAITNYAKNNHLGISIDKMKGKKGESKGIYIASYITAWVILKEPLKNEIKKAQISLALVKKENKQKEEKLDMLIKKLHPTEPISTKHLTDIRNIVQDEEKFLKILIKVAFYNKKTIEKLEKEELSEEKKAEIILRRSQYNYEKLKESTKEYLKRKSSKESLIEVLDFLRSNNLYLDYENLSLLIENYNKEAIKRIQPLINKGIIDNNIIIKNIKILYDEEIQTNFLGVLDVLLPELNASAIIKTTAQIILMNPRLIKDNLELLKQYKIKIKDKTLPDYDLLMNSSYFKIVDGLIEEGLGQVVKNHPEYIRERYLKLPKRVHISRKIGENIIGKGKIESRFLSEESYFLSDSELDFYLCNHTDEYIDPKIKEILNSNQNNQIEPAILNEELIVRLDSEYMFDDNYLFGEKIISRIKFLRNYTTMKNCTLFSPLDIIFNCLIEGSFLTDEELIDIKKSVKNLAKELTFAKK